MANPKTGKSAGLPSSSGATPSLGARATGALGSLANAFRPNFGKDTPMKGGSRITRLIMGTLIFVVVGQLLVTAEYALDSALKLGLQQPVFKGVTWITPFFVIYFVLLVGLWFGLNKFGFFPRPEPLPSTRSSGGSSSSKKGVTQIPGIGGPRPRRADVTPPTANGKKSAATPAKATAKPSATSSTQASSSGAYDDAYERVKAAQRQKRRRELH